MEESINIIQAFAGMPSFFEYEDDSSHCSDDYFLDEEEIITNDDTYPRARYISALKGFVRRKNIVRVVLLVVALLLLVPFTIRKNQHKKKHFVHHSHVPDAVRYLVWSDNCEMPNIDPYSPEVIKFLDRKNRIVCPTTDLSTRVVFNTTLKKYTLFVVNEFVHEENFKLKCCYAAILRITDNFVKLIDCLHFRDNVTLPEYVDNIVVKCIDERFDCYTNVHPLMPERNQLRKRVNDWKSNTTQRPINVLMLGIGSVSRVNLIRAMPKTAQYLYDNEWFEMSGYSKIGSKAFPNLMAILTGFKDISQCERSDLDRCPFIWNTFKEHGYVTAYGEDTSKKRTFNYNGRGFKNPPVDYYLQPLFIAAEGYLPVEGKDCIGSRPEASYVFDYALELDKRYRNGAYFGLFWTNRCRKDVNEPTSMDANMVNFLKKFAKRGIFKRSVVIFLSDHGMSWGPVRSTIPGYFEDRMPFLFIWLPQWLRDFKPEFVNALRMNTNRLTSPYDLHVTLKHILELSNRTEDLPPAPDCPKCQSLFKVVSNQRSCADAAIHESWCTCMEMVPIDMHSEIVKKMALLSVCKLNEIVAQYKNGSLTDVCAVHSLKYVTSARIIVPSYYTAPSGATETYVIHLTTEPNGAEFEALVRYFLKTELMEVIEDITRMSSYSPDADCTDDFYAKNICSCKAKKL